jgi:hypothetical protein
MCLGTAGGYSGGIEGCSPSGHMSYSVKFIAKPPYNAEVFPSASPALPARLGIDL